MSVVFFNQAGKWEERGKNLIGSDFFLSVNRNGGLIRFSPLILQCAWCMYLRCCRRLCRYTSDSIFYCPYLIGLFLCTPYLGWRKKKKEGTFCSDLLRMAGPCFLRFLSGRSRLPNSTANLAPNNFSVTSLRLPHTGG